MMEWTKDKPIQDGLYWAWNTKKDKAVMVRHGQGEWYRKSRPFLFADGLRTEIFEYSHWMGPLVEPDPPTDDEVTK